MFSEPENDISDATMLRFVDQSKAWFPLKKKKKNVQQKSCICQSSLIFAPWQLLVPKKMH